MEGAHLVMTTLPDVSPSLATALVVRDLRLSRGTRDVLAGVSFDVRQAELVGVMGLSGAGKTTILRAIAGLEPGASGSVSFGGQASPRGSGRRHGRARHVGMVFQAHFLFEHLTVLDNVCLAPMHVLGRTRRQAEDRARELLDELGIAHRAVALPRELSGGEAQRAAIARALAMDPPLLLLDEPTAALDPARRSSLGAALRLLARNGRAVLFTSHDVDFVRDHADRVIVLADGLGVETGDARDVLTSPSHAATRALLQETAAVMTHPPGALL